ncbi:hypothetical protein V8C86DRAFT_3036034 [Haematococcus lacustris]
MGHSWAEPIVVTSGGDFLRLGQGSESSPITEECRETCLATCDCLALSIDSETIYSHLSPRHLAALRGRRQRLLLMLTMEQRLGPAMTRCRVEGVLGFLGYCEAVQSVEIRLVMDEYTDEEPTYEQLPVGAWLAERLMSNFPNCHVLGLKPFIMLDSELLALLSHQLVVGRIKHVDIQTAILTGGGSDVPYEWVEPALGLTTLIATYLGPLPSSLRDRTCNLVKLSVTEMNITDVGNLPQSVTTLLISDLSVVLPERDMAALTRGVADLSSGRFDRQHIGMLGVAITSKQGCAQAAALLPLVGRFREALVDVGEPSQVIHCDVCMVQALRPDCSTSTMALTSLRPNPSDWVTITSDGDFFWFHEDGGRSLISNECHESCLATCECLVINIDSESITSHLSPRIQAALRIRRHPLALQLIVATLLGPHTMRCRLEGVVELLGCCEAVHSVEIRYIDEEQAMKEEPTYEQLPGPGTHHRVLAHRVLRHTHRVLRHTLGVTQDPVGVGQDPVVWCQDPVVWFQDPVVWCQDPVGVGQDPVVWCQDPVVWCQDPVGQDPDPVVWYQDPVGQDPVVRCQDPVVKSQDPVVSGPCGVVPGPCGPGPCGEPCPSKLVKLCLTEMHLTATSLLPQTIKILNITYLHVTLPEPDHQAMTSGVAALSSGRFQTLEIEYMGLSITSLEGGGHASLQALKPLVGRFRRAEVELGVIAPNGVGECELVIHNMVKLLQGCAGVVFTGYTKPLSSWCMYRLKDSMAQGATVEVQE